MSDLPHLGYDAPLPEKINVGAVLDQGAFTVLQRLIVVMVALTIVLDGFDSQLLGFAVPLMMADWALPRDAFTFAVMASSTGMMAGSLASGLLADRIGRRRVILLTLPVCGVATCLVGMASEVWQVALFRFLAGVGIGGAFPVCTIMAAEFAPLRYRTMLVTASIVCVPLGGMLAGFFSGFFLYSLGWRLTFYIGGILPLALLLLLWFTLPESPRFLARHRRRWSELRYLLGRLGKSVAENAVFSDEEKTTAAAGGGIRDVFRNGMARDTLSIWAVFFFGMIAVYAVFGWLPAILITEGVSRADAGYGLTVYNIGGVAGAFICAWIISRLGSWRTMAVFAACGAASVFALLLFDIAGNISLMLLLLGLHGLFADGIQSPLYALAAHLYPTRIRATGTATAAACGRAGGICAGFAGGVVGGVTGYFILLGVCMLLVLLALACIRRHIPSIRVLKPHL